MLSLLLAAMRTTRRPTGVGRTGRRRVRERGRRDGREGGGTEEREDGWKRGRWSTHGGGALTHSVEVSVYSYVMLILA